MTDGRTDYAVAADVLRDLGRHVHLTRRALGVSQHGVASQVGVALVTIGHLERGVRTPSVPVVIRLLEWLDRAVTSDEPVEDVASPDVEPST